MLTSLSCSSVVASSEPGRWHCPARGWVIRDSGGVDYVAVTACQDSAAPSHVTLTVSAGRTVPTCPLLENNF